MPRFCWTNPPFTPRCARCCPPAGTCARVRALRTRADGVDLDLDTGTLAARHVIDARGRAGLRGAGRAGAAVVALAFSGRLDTRAAPPVMLLEALEGGWLWAAVLPGGPVRGALHLPATALAGLDGGRRATRLARDLAASAPDLPGQVQAGDVAPATLQTVPDPCAVPRVLRIGDAALAQDPIAAHGLIHALRSGVQGAAALATLLDPQGAGDAAQSLVRTRHQAAVQSAKAATARALADQVRHPWDFWPGPALALSPPKPSPGFWPGPARWSIFRPGWRGRPMPRRRGRSCAT